MYLVKLPAYLYTAEASESSSLRCHERSIECLEVEMNLYSRSRVILPRNASRTFHTQYACSFPVTDLQRFRRRQPSTNRNAYQEEPRLPHTKFISERAAMNLRNEMASEKGNRHQIQRFFHPPPGQVAVAALLGPTLPFRTHVSSRYRNDLAGDRNWLRGRGTTYSINVQAAQCPRFISEEAGWDRTCGGGDNRKDKVMLCPTYPLSSGHYVSCNLRFPRLP